MSNPVDVRDLAIDRNNADGQSGTLRHARIRQHVWTRYVLPLMLICGFSSMVIWAMWDFFDPSKSVLVVPVFSTSIEVRQAGTPLFKAAGWIEPRPTPVRVAALAPGVVEELLVVEDQLVQAGDPIAELVKDDASLAYDRALADLELRRAELDAVNATFIAAETRFKQPVHLQAALGESEAALAGLETALKNLPFEVQRAEADYQAKRRDYDGKTSAKGVVAAIEIDIAESLVNSSKATVEELRLRFASLEQERMALVSRRDALKTHLELLADETRERDEAKAQVQAAKARLSQVRVAVAEAKLRLQRMTIVAPVDGRIFRLFAHPGARIGSGVASMIERDGSTVVTMYQPERLQVRVDVRFEDIPRVSLNQPVQINNPALASPLMGSVLFVSSEADIQKNTLQVKVAIPDPPPIFRPEMLVDVTFLADRPLEESSHPSRQRKYYVPQQLVHQDDRGRFLWSVDQSEGIAHKLNVQTGPLGPSGLVEITHGMTNSHRIISTGSDGLHDGQRVRVTGEDPVFGTEFTIESGAVAQDAGYLKAGEQE